MQAQEEAGDVGPEEAALMLEKAFQQLTCQDGQSGDSSGRKEALRTLTSISSLSSKLLASLPLPRAEESNCSRSPPPDHRLPAWARTVADVLDPAEAESHMLLLRTLSVLVSGLVRIGVESTAGDESHKDYAVVNVCWKTVLAILTNKTIVQVAKAGIQHEKRYIAEDGRQALEAPENQVPIHVLLQARPVEIEDVMGVLLRLTVYSLCKAVEVVAPALFINMEDEEESQNRSLDETQSQTQGDSQNYRQRLMVVKFFQNTSIRLGALYPEATMSFSSLLICLTSSISTLLRQEGGPISKPQSNLTASILGGHMFAFLTSLLASRSSQGQAHKEPMIQQLCNSGLVTSGQEHRGMETAHDCVLLQKTKQLFTALKNMAVFYPLGSAMHGVIQSNSCSIKVPDLEAGGQLLMLASILEGSAKYPTSVLKHLVDQLPSIMALVTSIHSFDALVSPYGLPPATRGEGKTTADLDHFILLHRLSHGFKVMAAAIVSSVQRHKSFPGQQDSMPDSEDQRAPGSQMQLWTRFQQFLFQWAADLHPLASELATDTWQSVLPQAGNTLAVKHVSLLLTTLDRALAVSCRILQVAVADCSDAAHQLSFGVSSKHLPEQAQKYIHVLLQRLGRTASCILSSVSKEAFSEVFKPLRLRTIQSLSPATEHPAEVLRLMLKCGFSEVLRRQSESDWEVLYTELLSTAQTTMNQLSTEPDGALVNLLARTLECLFYLQQTSSIEGDIICISAKAISVSSKLVSSGQQGSVRGCTSAVQCSDLLEVVCIALALLLQVGTDCHQGISGEVKVHLMTGLDVQKHLWLNQVHQDTSVSASRLPSIIVPLCLTTEPDVQQQSLELVSSLWPAVATSAWLPLQHEITQSILRAGEAGSSGPERPERPERPGGSKFKGMLQELGSLEAAVDPATLGSWLGGFVKVIKEQEKLLRRSSGPSSNFETQQSPGAAPPSFEQGGVGENKRRGHLRSIQMDSQQSAVVEDSSTGSPGKKRRVGSTPKPTIVQTLDSANAALEGVLIEVQEAQGAQLPFSDIMEKIQEADGILRKLKSICRKCAA